jgi:subtilisin family serine protease
VSVLSAFPTGGYGSKSGTSMASPHLAGVVAIMLQAEPSLTRDELFEALTSTATDLGDTGYDHDFGHGRIDVVAALGAAARIVRERARLR